MALTRKQKTLIADHFDQGDTLEEIVNKFNISKPNLLKLLEARPLSARPNQEKTSITGEQLKSYQMVGFKFQTHEKHGRTLLDVSFNQDVKYRNIVKESVVEQCLEALEEIKKGM